MLSRVPRHTWLAAGLFLVGGAADVVTTYVAISTGNFVERSPIGAPFISTFGLFWGTVLTKTLAIPLFGALLVSIRRNRALLATTLLAGAGVLSLLAASYNVLLYLGLL
ncbi:MAG: hypothetical protein ABEH81_14210 [Halopenitus sp.]